MKVELLELLLKGVDAGVEISPVILSCWVAMLTHIAGGSLGIHGGRVEFRNDVATVEATNEVVEGREAGVNPLC